MSGELTDQMPFRQAVLLIKERISDSREAI